jgi:uncharacterized protein
MATHSERETECRGVPYRVEYRSSRTIGGLGAVFDSVSENLGGFVEVVSPSFFLRSQSDGWPNVVSFYNHRSEMLLGATHSGTLRLENDGKRGLDYEVDLPISREDTLEAVRRGDCAFSSFSFICYEDRFSDWNGQVLRTLVSGRLLEVGPTPIPAYTATSAAMRSLARQVDAPVETVLDYAERGELRSFVARSDMKLPVVEAKFRSGRRKAVEAQRYPDAPIGANKRRRRSGKQAQLEVLAAELNPTTGKPFDYGRSKPLTIKQKQVATLGMRWPAEHVKPKTRKQIETELQGMREPGYE